MNHVFYYKKDPGVCTTGASSGGLATTGLATNVKVEAFAEEGLGEGDDDEAEEYAQGQTNA